MKTLARRFVLFLGCLAGLSLLSLPLACSDDEKEFEEYLTLEPGSGDLNFGNAAATQTVTFNTGQEWTATLSSGASTWCSINPASGKAGNGQSIAVTVTKNETENIRSAQLTIVAGKRNESVSITQAAKEQEVVTVPDGLSYSPEAPDADYPLTVTFKATGQSALYGYSGEVYAHIGVVSGGDWMYVPADWNTNISKCKMASEGANTWSLTLAPSIREWFGSGETPVKKIGIVIRSADGSKKGIEDDSFITVTDTKYKGFEPAAVKNGTMPSDVVEGINVVDNSTVTLVLYDVDINGGYKDYAYVVGDFNNWTLSNDEKSQMYRDEAGGCWWITLTGLEATREYRFQYYVGKGDEITYLADAYTEKILDPYNDPYITSTYTEPMDYPDGGHGNVSTFKIQKDSYPWRVTDFKIENPDKLVIYELWVGNFTDKNNLQGVMDKFDYLKAMGVNAIELMPVQEFDGNDSWGYNPCFNFAMDKAYGTKTMYKQFIDQCHEAGIAVILDVVYNHATGSHPFAKLYWDGGNNKTAANNPYFNVTEPHPYGAYHDFNHESPLVRKFIKRNLKFLLEEYKIDGFRFDMTKGFTQKSSTEATASNYDASRIAILKEYNAAIKEVKPDAYVILEHFCNMDEETELAADGMHLWCNANNAYCQTAMGWQDESDFTWFYGRNPSWIVFMESHDEERMSYKQSQWGDGALKTDLATRMEQLKLNTAFFLTTPGPKMIWQFGELGYDYSINSNEAGTATSTDYRTQRKPLRWNYLDDSNRKGLYEVYCQLMKLRNDHPELFTSPVAFTHKAAQSDWTGGRSLYVESTTGKRLAVVGNFTATATEVTFPASAGTWKDYFTGESESVGSKVTLPAHGYKVYVNF